MKTIFLTAFLVAVTYAQTCLDSADRAINGRCFKLVNQQMSWTDARDWCHHRSPVAPSYLATVLDTTTSNFLASYARTAFNTNEGYYWIGLSRYNTSSRWQWDDGTPVSWTNFDKNNQQPYNYVDGSITNGKFYTSTNDHKYNFICSYNPNAVQTAGTTVTTGDTTTPAWTETEAPSPTPTEDTSCTSTTQPPTFLFAYSNDFSQQTILDTWNAFLSVEDQVNLQYSTFGSVRFDLQNAEDIQWNTNYRDVASSINSHLPDPNLGFQSSSTGSDVIRTIEKFFNNGQIQVCGSVVMILLKRYPNETDISGIVSKIRSHHAVVHVVTSSDPSGGLQPKTAYNIASKSNGLGAFERDNEFSDMIGRFPLFATPFPIYTTNVQVSGKGSMSLPPMTAPRSDDYYVSITYQDHLPLDSFEKIDLSWYTDKLDPVHFVETIGGANGEEDGGTYTSGWSGFDNVVYSMKLEYEYSNSNVENLQIRICSGTPLNYWLPYSD